MTAAADKGVRQAKAARALAAGETKAAAARAAEVDPSAITRWMKEPSFKDMILRAGEPADTPKDMAVQGLADLVPLALRTLLDALEGADISPAQQTVALKIVESAKKWEPKALTEEGPSTLWSAIQEIDGSQPA